MAKPPKPKDVSSLTHDAATRINNPTAEMASIHAALAAGLENGTLRPVIGKEFPLADAAQAHRAVIKSGATGKIVLVSSK